MRIIPAIFLATVIVITVAFPTPQESKTTSKTEPDEHVLMVKKIDIHVEVKSLPVEKDTPTTALVSEISELLKNPKKDVESPETPKLADAETPAPAKSSESIESSEVVKTPEALKSFVTETSPEELKPVEVVKETPKVVADSSKVADTAGAEEGPAELKDEKSDVKVLHTSLDQAVEATSKPKPAIVEALQQSVIDATAETKSDASGVEKTVPTEPSQISTVSETKKTVELEQKIAKETEDEVKTVVGETKTSETSKPKANKNDSEENDSSEEASKETSKELSTKTSAVDTKATSVETVKVKDTSVVKTNEEASEAKPDEAALEKSLPVLTEKNEQQTKSVVEKTVTSVEKDLANKKQLNVVEPQYRTIPVTIVHDDPTVENIAVKTVSSEEITQKKEVQPDGPVGSQVPLNNDPVIKTTVATTASEDNPVTVVEPVAVVTPEKSEAKLSAVKTTEAEITKPEEQKTTTAETKAEDSPVVGSADKVISLTGSIDDGLNKKEDTSVVSAVKVVKAVEQQDTVKAEPPKEPSVKIVESVKDEGSSTKAASEDSESSEEKVENSSISRSTVVTKALNDASNKGEVTEEAKEPATEQADTTTTAATTTASVKSEGKKGKKKLPGSNKKQNTI
ncbi:titin homolog isoform X2 [Armigeres subalbatus]|uniref:titin homolog isoform X2 n=1 Tax=Armigeres subalbatus TaxID=124917 RepID=UPI002ED55A7A